MKKLALFFAMALAGCNASSVVPEKAQVETRQDMEQYCLQNPCRRNVTVNLRTNGKPVNERLEIYKPIVQGLQLSILPGEEINIEMEVKNDKVVSLKSVDAIEKPDITMTFKFMQQEDDIGMNLIASNPFGKPVKYHLDMIDFRGRAHQTSSCPAIRKGAAYETWPHPIPELVISDIHFIQDDDSLLCVY